MEWQPIINVISTPLLAFFGVLVAERTKLKTKKLEVDESNSKAISACQASHKNDIEQVRKEFNERLDEMSEKLDDIKSESLRTSLLITETQKDVQKHNGVIERTIILERDMAVLMNRESVSEHRISDLEKKAQ